MDSTDYILRQKERLALQKTLLEKEQAMLEHFIRVAKIYETTLETTKDDILRVTNLIADLDSLLPASNDNPL